MLSNNVKSSILYTKCREIKFLILRLAYRLLWVFPIEDGKVIFSNFNGKGYGDNPKYIAQEIASRHKGKMYWLCKQPDNNLPSYITSLEYGTLKAMYHLATAAVWIDNNRKEPYMAKRKKQYYVQAWHGSIALKRIEKDAEDTLNSFYIDNAKRDSKMIDLMVSNSSFADRMFGKSFWYQGRIEKLGSARLDSQFDDKIGATVRNSLNIPVEDVVVLYAPTFRNNNRIDVYDIDMQSVASAFSRLFGKTVTILVRMHPNISQEKIKYNYERLLYVNDYPDVYELLNASDVLITDYSSLMFEFPINKIKPVICYAKDIDDYDRGFYFDLKSLPFTFCESNEKLVKEIDSFDMDAYSKSIKHMFKDLELLEDGHASERIVSYLEEIGKL